MAFSFAFEREDDLMRRFAWVLVLLLFGCNSAPGPRVTALSAEAQPATISGQQPETQQACDAKGGQWLPDCRPNERRCLMPYPDAGKRCTDSSECESNMCVTDLDVVCEVGKGCPEPQVPAPGSPAVGICKRNNERCGSFYEIKHGIAQPPRHVD